MNKTNSTSDDIIACARSLIIAGGYNGFSYADVAGKVGIRKASIHHHFPSKVDLVKTLIVQHREGTEAGLGALERDIARPLDQLRAYLGYWERCIGDASAPFCLCALLASELPILPADVALEVRDYFRFLSGWLAAVLGRAAQDGALRLARSADVEAETFMATVHGAMLSARTYGDAEVFGLILNAHLDRLTTASTAPAASSK
jgi:TetR/AcrR family transcriptional repressor of nem operon